MVQGNKADGAAGRAGAAMIKALFAAGALLAAAPGFAQVRCDRTDLENSANAYLAAQAAGDPIKLPLADFTQYDEQMETSTMFGGTLAKPLKIDFHRNLLDVEACTTFVEAIVTDPAHPYVIGARLQFSGRTNPIAPSRVNEIELVVTDKGDWFFNANKTLAYSRAENWGEIPVAERDSRATIVAAANAYLDSFSDKTKVVPWGTPCARLEGGVYSGKGAPGTATPDDTCNVGVPAGVKIKERRYIVDEVIGAVAVMVRFGNNELPDVHTFRVEKGKIRYVHTMTVCKTDNCGLPMSDEIRKRLED